MSSVSTIVAFDYIKFKETVISALNEGETNTIIKKEIERDNFTSSKFENLNKIISLFDTKISSCTYGQSFAADKNGIYKTSNKFDRPNENCWTYEDLAILLERLIMRNCAKYHLNLGKISRLELVISSKNTSVQNSLNKLCNGGNYWAHCSADDNGIYGWLNIDEVKYLNNHAELIDEVNSRDQSNSLINSFRDFLEIAAINELGIMFGNSLDFEIVGHNKSFTIGKLVTIEEDCRCEPTFELEEISDYR